MKFEVVATWSMTANILVEAESLKEAEEKATKALKGMMTDEEIEASPYCSYGPECVDNSLEVKGESGNGGESYFNLFSEWRFLR